MAEGKNRHAKTLLRMKDRERMWTTERAIELSLALMTIELNEEFGFGRKRLTQCALGFGKLMDQYSAIVIKDGVERADAWLKRRNEEIMGEG